MQKNSFSAAQWFVTTHWTLVFEAARHGQALDQWCTNYWPPVYAFLRRRGYSPAEAKDLTQDFFATFIEKNHFRHLKDRRGKFRSFLLTFLKHYLSDVRDRKSAQKRGGGKVIISYDDFTGEERSKLEPVDNLSPDLLFDRRWAESILSRARSELEKFYLDSGESSFFYLVRPNSGEELSDAEIATRLGMSEGAVKSAKRRLRQRYARLVRTEILRTVSSPEDLAEEIRYFLETIAQGS